MIPRFDVFCRQFWRIASLLIIVYVAVFAFSMIAAPDTLQVQYAADDGYYYLGLARNFARSGVWAVDSRNATSGFHMLWAYLLAAVYWLAQPTDGQFVLWALSLSLAITLLALLGIWWEGVRGDRDPAVLLLGAILFSSRNLLYNSVSLTEWPLVVLCAYLCFTRWYQNGRKSLIVLFGAALLGTLARTDFVLLPLVLFAISLVVFCFDRRREALFRALAGFGGAAAGLLLMAMNNYVFAGSLLQSSALTKAHWTAAYRIVYNGRVPPESFSLLSDLLGFDGSPLVLKIVAFTAAGITALYLLAKALWRWDKKRLGELASVLGALFVFGGYTLVYANNAATQSWYTASLLIPVGVLGTAALRSIWTRYGQRVHAVLGLVALVLILHNVLSAVPLDSERAPWPHQQAMLEAGKYLRQARLDGPVAAWNAGIIGYYEGGTVVNIDGLVNNAVYSYVVNNDLGSYLVQNKIRYIVDFRSMVETEYLRVRGGYDDARFPACLDPLKVFDRGQYVWQYLTLYRILPCMGVHPSGASASRSSPGVIGCLSSAKLTD